MRSVIVIAAFLLAVQARAESPKAERIFNGKDLTGWTAFLWDAKNRKEDKVTPPGQVWTVKDGVLTTKGRPVGYLKTNRAFGNYRLELEWRWKPGSKGGNSGVLVHTTTPFALGCWPKSVEVQLYRNNAGDFWAIGTSLEVPDMEKRKKGRRHLNLTDDSEKPVGEWNRLDVRCKGREIKVFVNGVLVNHATKCSEEKGAIALQAEGAEIHFRNIVVTPLGK